MERIDLTKQFSHRLRTALINAGYGSTRSTTGVHLQKFSTLIGYSIQICRKYLHGQAIPDLTKLTDIADRLNVSPGWLLFGDCHAQHPLEAQKVTISKPLLHYIFSHANQLYHATEMHPTLPDFLLELTHDVSQINADDEQSKKIIDLALHSVKRFRTISTD